MRHFILYLLFSLLIGIFPVRALADHPVTPQAIMGVIDKYWLEHKDETLTPGMAVAVVKAGHDPAVKGYGLADLESATPVKGRNTVFRLASVSKIFVSFAVLQQVALGELDLDVDIKSYVPDIDIENPLGRPVTLRQLLTHQAGIDEQFQGDMTRHQQDRESLGVHLARRLPPVVRPPGEASAYSNYGYALAAYVVEKVTNMPFDAYARTHIFEPLGMYDTSYVRTPRIDRKLATGYEVEGGMLERQPYTYVHRYPPTSAMSTARDMARFAMAMLAEGCLGEVCLLPAELRPLAFGRQYSGHDLLPGRSLAFMEWPRNGVTGWWHDGAHVGFQAEFIFLPEANIGLFIAINSKDSPLPGRLKRAVLDHFWPYTAAEPQRFPTQKDLRQLVGDYRDTRRAEASFEKVGNFQRKSVSVELDNDGDIVIFGRKLVPIGPLVFAEADNGLPKLAFEEDSKGNIVRAHMDWGGGPASFDRVEFWDQPKLHMGIFVFLLLGHLAALIWYLRKRKSYARGLYRSAVSVAGTALVFILGFGATLATLDPTVLRFDEAHLLNFFLKLPILLLVFLAVFTALAIKERSAQRAHWLFISLCVLTLGEFHYWNFITL